MTPWLPRSSVGASKTRGELDQAEAMYRKALELYQAVEAKPKIEHVQNLLEQLRQ